MNPGGQAEGYKTAVGNGNAGDSQESGVTVVGPQAVNVFDLPQPSAAAGGEAADIPPVRSEGPAGSGGPPAQANAVDSASSPPTMVGARFEGLDTDINPLRTEPPDPQVAVGPNHVFQMVNKAGRIYTRAGATLQTFTLASFFGVPPGATNDFDPKLLHDALSGRWLAGYVSLKDNPSGQPDEGRLHIAVSMTSDPFGWNIYQIA